MKLLFEGPATRRIASCFPLSFVAGTVAQIGWAGGTNGDLLRRAVTSRFDAPIAVDRGSEFQQDTSEPPISVKIMITTRSRVQDLQVVVPGVFEVLSGNLQRRIYPVRVWIAGVCRKVGWIR